MDKTEKELLDLIQADFPITEEPYKEIGDKKGLSEDVAFNFVNGLIKKNYVRKIGPFFNSKRIGFKSTLVAVKADPNKVNQIAKYINNFKEVTHNYERKHDYNIWFTLIAQNSERIDEIIMDIARQEGVLSIHNLPAKKLLKINVNLRVGSREPAVPRFNIGGAGGKVKSNKTIQTRVSVLTEDQKELIKAIQSGIPINKRPFDVIAAFINKDSNWVVSQIRQWISEGIIRRFGAALNHIKAGYSYNAMVVWRSLPEDEESVAERLADNPSVSHCYIRPDFDDFHFTIYTMIHSKTLNDLEKTIEKMALLPGIINHQVVMSVNELKKTSPSYF